MMEVMGVGRLPEEAFGSEPAYMDWLDTEESQRLLQYQPYYKARKKRRSEAT